MPRVSVRHLGHPAPKALERRIADLRGIIDIDDEFQPGQTNLPSESHRASD
jgi:hypothetical protein